MQLCDIMECRLQAISRKVYFQQVCITKYAKYRKIFCSFFLNLGMQYAYILYLGVSKVIIIYIYIEYDSMYGQINQHTDVEITKHYLIWQESLFQQCNHLYNILGGLRLPPRDTLNNHICNKIISYKTGVLLSFLCDVYKYNN